MFHRCNYLSAHLPLPYIYCRHGFRTILTLIAYYLFPKHAYKCHPAHPLLQSNYCTIWQYSIACTLSLLKVHIWKCFKFKENVSGMRKPERSKTALAPQKAPARSPPLKHEGACDLALIVLGEGTEGTLLYKPHLTLMSPSGSKSGLLTGFPHPNPIPRAAHSPKSCVSTLWLTRSSRSCPASRGGEPKQLKKRAVGECRSNLYPLLPPGQPRAPPPKIDSYKIMH